VPYLDSKIGKHRSFCTNPVGKRLYIRDYDEKGKQRFVSWGVTCTTCGVVVKEIYPQNLTSKQLEDKEIHEQTKDIFARFSGKNEEWPEYFERQKLNKVRSKLERLRRKKQGKAAITPRESGLRRRIRGLKKFYQLFHWFRADDVRLDFDWDADLVEKFLKLSPRPSIAELRSAFDPPEFVINLDSRYRNKDKGYVPFPEKPGKLKYDREAYIKLLRSEALKRQERMQEVIKSRE
jgi:hypothetical protein